MNKTSEFKRIWYKGERELATLDYRYKRAFAKASTVGSVLRINGAYEAKKTEIETRRYNELRALSVR